MSGAEAAYFIGNLDGNDGTDSPNLTGGRIKAMGFTLAAGNNYLLTDAILRLRIKGDGVEPTIQIWSNGGSNVPTTLLATLTDPPIPKVSSIIGDISFAPSSPLTLAGGASYWLVASDTINTSPTTYDWMASSSGITPTGLATHLGSLFGTNGISSLQSFGRPEQLPDRRDHHPLRRARAGEPDPDGPRPPRHARLPPASSRGGPRLTRRRAFSPIAISPVAAGPRRTNFDARRAEDDRQGPVPPLAFACAGRPGRGSVSFPATRAFQPGEENIDDDRSRSGRIDADPRPTRHRRPVPAAGGPYGELPGFVAAARRFAPGHHLPGRQAGDGSG
jgi:hypothetical protein